MSKRLSVKILRLPHGDGVPLPKYMSHSASGMDIYAAVEGEITLKPGERRLVPTGFKMALPEGHEAQVRPRSGLAVKNGISVLNTPGTIDEDYRGEVGVILINHSNEEFKIKRGDRIAQMVINKVEQADIEVVESLSETGRNSGGFGHTGV
ncbi:MAG: dUTP diphosphatase [bacterium]